MRIWFVSKTPTESLLGTNPEKTLKSHSLPSAKKAVKKYCLKIKNCAEWAKEWSKKAQLTQGTSSTPLDAHTLTQTYADCSLLQELWMPH